MMVPRDTSVYAADLGAIGLAGIIYVLLRRRLTLLLVIVAFCVCSLAYALLSPPIYEATCTFISSSQITGDSGFSSLGAISSAASRLGVELPGRTGDLSPLYPWMLQNREIGREILTSQFPDSKGRLRTLLDELAPANLDSLRRMDIALERLHRKALSYSFDRKSGVTRITAALRDPVLAASVANAFVIGLDRYNQAVLAGNAGSFATFLEERLQGIEDQIRVEESALRDFRTANRGFAQSPALVLEEARLSRNLNMAQQIYLNVRSQFELVRMEEFKRLPRLTVIDEAHPPYRKSRPRIGSLVALSGFMGAVVAAIWVLGSTHWRWYKSTRVQVSPEHNSPAA